MSQQFDLADAQLRPDDCPYEPFDFLGVHTIHAHERPQRCHVRVHGERTPEEHLLDRGAHLGQEIAARADPRLAPREHLGHIGDRHPVRRQQFAHEAGLLEDGERPLPAGTQ